MPEKNDYDAIIIGAGISGLVCGCYLTKAGMKVLIVEKNAKPGGYCTSFTRDGFQFDACVHSLSSLRDNGNLKIILNELDLYKKIIFERLNPSDIIITPKDKITFWNDPNKTIRELQYTFPDEAENIVCFFNYISNFNPLISASLLNITFDKLLNKYFKNNKLKSIFSILIQGNAGLPPSMISAFPAIILFKEFILDGGYYLKSGMQTLPNALATRFKEFGGTLLLNHTVNKIKIKNNSAIGIIFEGNKLITAKYVVSNGDGKNTCLKLIGKNNLHKIASKKILNLTPSLSAFSIYLGLNKSLENTDCISNYTNLWYLPNDNIKHIYSLINSGRLDHKDVYFVLFLRGNVICLFVNAPFKNKIYWEKNKDNLTDQLLNRISKLFPDLSNKIAMKIVATPHTLYKQTLNFKGAAYGWSASCSQHIFSDPSKFITAQNLFLTGHWTSLAFGVPGVAFLGRKTALSILNNDKTQQE